MTTLHARPRLGAAILVSVSICGCASDRGASALQPGISPKAERTDIRPVLLVGGRAISRDAVWPMLAEYGGSDVIREIVLDQAVAEELARAGLGITEADIETERTRLMTRLAPDLNTEESAEISRAVLESRGLGPERLRGLLTRNAGLRKLIGNEGAPTQETIELAYRVRYGPKREVRLITTNTAASAQSAVAEIRIRAEEIGLLSAFAEFATRKSTDTTANLGGSLGAISTEDPGLPVAIRSVLRDLKPMTLSAIIAMDSGYAVLLVEKDVPPEDTTIEEIYAELEADVRERHERLQMETRARQLLDEYRPSVLDGSLRWSWDKRGELGPR